MKHSKIFSAWSMLILTLIVSIVNSYAQQPPFQVSDNELQALNLSPTEAQEFQQFIETLNHLPQEELDFLAQAGQEIEKQMKDKGLDPANPDDIFKWVEQQSDAEKPTEQPKTKAPTELPTSEVTATPMVSATSPADTRVMLKDIIKHLASLRQKSTTRETLNQKLERWKQELTELTYYLNILTQEELVAHLSSKDFSKLHKNLEKLHNALATHEPLIAARAPITDDEDDPYEVLGVSYTVTQDQIKEAYETLKNERGPQAVAEQLKDAGISGKVLEKQVKEARLIFSFIQNAYDSLKDPKQRALIDRTLKDRIAYEKRAEKASLDAFNKLISAVSTALYDHKVLNDIQQLLEKYKPQELAKAKEQEALEKKAYERSKQPGKIAQSFKLPPALSSNQYDTFYQQVAQDAFARNYYNPYQHNTFNEPYYKGPSDSFSSMSPSAEPTKPAKPGTPEEGAKDKDKKEKEADKDKKDKKDKGISESRKSEKEEKPTKKLSKEDENEVFALIEEIAQDLATLPDDIEVEEKQPVRSAPQTEEQAEQTDVSSQAQEQEPAPQTPGTNENMLLSNQASTQANPAYTSGTPRQTQAPANQVRATSSASAVQGTPVDIDAITEGDNSEETPQAPVAEKPKKKVKKVKLKDVMSTVNKYLMAPVKRAPQPQATEALQQLSSFAQQFQDLYGKIAQFRALAEDYALPDKIRKAWHDQVHTKHAQRINNWYNEIYPVLSLQERKNRNIKGINQEKAKMHGLDEEKKEKLVRGKKKAPSGVNLADIRTMFQSLHTNFNDISQKFGIIKPQSAQTSAKVNPKKK